MAARVLGLIGCGVGAGLGLIDFLEVVCFVG